ncbi:hypothetical protein [Neobacillus ginsengisoli]|uniref:Uncharacterized protein n=1 Tax=Neobacillus ginsengisoli TaxID=904295 RepID=A0ABT9XNG5_9BACI|nr:hypothetical protein [Neobacillus ginsengisoli]MDQ0197090.1 hypothetical protein [Neobacillus ginsengisoli]
MSNVSFIIDNDLLESMQFESFLISPHLPNTGVFLMSENSSPFSEAVTIKMYRLGRTHEEEGFQMKDDMGSILLSSSVDAKLFIEEFPHMSAIELLLLQQLDTMIQ